MSFGGKKTSQSERVDIVPQLDPIARAALERVVSATAPFDPRAGLPAVAPIDAATIAGLQRLQDRPQSAFIPAGEGALTDFASGAFVPLGAAGGALGLIGQTTGGQFFGANPAVGAANDALGAVEDRILRAAQRAVGDQFSLAGRTGSPAQAISLGSTVARELAPFAFNAQEAALGRQFQGFENERQRQLAAAGLGLDAFGQAQQQRLSSLALAPQFESLLDSVAQRLLQVGDILQSQNQLRVDEPFLQFERFSNPLLAAAGRFPVSTTRTGVGSSTSFGGGFNLF